MPYTIYLVDDHPIILRSLHDVIEGGGGHKIIGETGTVEVAQREILAKKPKVSVIDLNLNGESGLDLIEYLQDHDHNVKIVVYSMRNNIQTIAAAYRAGAHAYIPKSEDPMELLPAIEYAAKGRRYFVGDIAEKLAEFHATGNPEDPGEILTEREFEIFMEAAHGLDIDQIAEKLNLVSGSISNRLVRIRKKLNLTNQVEFALLAVKYGYITQDSL